jgi:hypothetical protein
VLFDAPALRRPKVAHGTLEVLLRVPCLDVALEEHEPVRLVVAQGARVPHDVVRRVVVGHLPREAGGKIALRTLELERKSVGKNCWKIHVLPLAEHM